MDIIDCVLPPIELVIKTSKAIITLLSKEQIFHIIFSIYLHFASVLFSTLFFQTDLFIEI